MPEFSGLTWFLLAAAAAGGILALLNYLASSVRNQRIVHDLKIEVIQLQSNYLRKLKELKELEDSQVDL